MTHLTRNGQIGASISNSDLTAAGDTGSEPWLVVFAVALKCVSRCDADGSLVGAGDEWLVICHTRARYVTLAKGNPSRTSCPRAKQACSQQSRDGSIIKHTLAASAVDCSSHALQKGSKCPRHPDVQDSETRV